jgi:hypothetical protein
METIQQVYSPVYASNEKGISVITRFFRWCKAQEKYRFGWVAAIIAAHGCALTPITLFFIYLGGNNMTLWAFAIGAMGMSLIANLAAMPTKITIPVFFLSALIDLSIIVLSITHMAGI